MFRDLIEKGHDISITCDNERGLLSLSIDDEEFMVSKKDFLSLSEPITRESIMSIKMTNEEIQDSYKSIFNLFKIKF